MDSAQREVTIRIRNGVARGHHVRVPLDEGGRPPLDVFVRIVDNRAVVVWRDVRPLGKGVWTPYMSQQAPGGGWELVEARAPGPGVSN